MDSGASAAATDPMDLLRYSGCNTESVALVYHGCCDMDCSGRNIRFTKVRRRVFSPPRSGGDLVTEHLVGYTWIQPPPQTKNPATPFEQNITQHKDVICCDGLTKTHLD